MLTRATLLTYLANTLHPLAGSAGVAETDSADGYAYALDQAFARNALCPHTAKDRRIS